MSHINRAHVKPDHDYQPKPRALADARAAKERRGSNHEHAEEASA